jgi:hypothetical protein
MGTSGLLSECYFPNPRARSRHHRGDLDILVRHHMRPLSEENLIGADAGILDFVRDADRQRCRLVISGREIGGLVTLSVKIPTGKVERGERKRIVDEVSKAD